MYHILYFIIFLFFIQVVNATGKWFSPADGQSINSLYCSGFHSSLSNYSHQSASFNSCLGVLDVDSMIMMLMHTNTKAVENTVSSSAFRSEKICRKN